jgi:hypothetical protein
MREHVLPRPALAGQQHGGGGVRRLPRRRQHAAHGRIGGLEHRGRLDRAPELAVLAAEPAHLEDTLEEEADLVELEGLHEVVVRALAHRLDRRRARSHRRS